MWLVPSRGRPHLAQKLFDSGIKERGILIIDDDDEDNYAQVRLPFRWQRLVLQRQYLSQKLNAAFEANPNEPWYGILNDDHLPVTPGWEQAIIAKAGRNGIAWPDDNYGKRISCHVKGGDLCRKLGWFVCPRMMHFWLDDADELIAKEVPGGFMPHIMVSHEHVNAGRMPMDRTYRERPNNAKDRAAWERWRAEEWPAVKAKLSICQHPEKVVNVPLK